ncbi:MAG: TRAP transporter substrate-binding protein DctP [Chloroflexi bacterium]|nr:TRAP transporter substrate-binding protein DctP [Chloroflexota bacterium]
MKIGKRRLPMLHVILGSILVFMLVLPVLSCGPSAPAPAPKPTPTATPAPAPKPATTAAPAPAPAPKPTPTATPAAKALPEITWKLSGRGQRRTSMEGMEKMSELVAQKTGGKFQIKIYYAEQLAPAKQELDGLKAGLFQAAYLTASEVPGKLPLSTVFDLPFLPGHENKWRLAYIASALYSEFKPLQDELAQWGATYFFNMTLPSYQIVSKAPMTKVEDLKGKIFRATKEQGQVLEKFGASAVMLAGAEIFPSFERGVIDALIFADYGAISYGLFQVGKYWSEGIDFGTVGSAIFLMKKSEWDSLPGEYKKAITSSYGEAYKYQIDNAYAISDKDFAGTAAKEKVQILKFDPASRQKLEDQAQGVWDTWIGTSQVKKDLLNRVKELAKVTPEEARSRMMK